MLLCLYVLNPCSVLLFDVVVFVMCVFLFVCLDNNRVCSISIPSGQWLCNYTTKFPALNRPEGIAFDEQQNLYIADYFNGRVVKLSQQGQISTSTHTNTQSTHTVCLPVFSRVDVFVLCHVLCC